MPEEVKQPVETAPEIAPLAEQAHSANESAGDKAEDMPVPSDLDSGNVASAELAPSGEPLVDSKAKDESEKKQYKRGQTCKDRREFAAKKRRTRNMEQNDESKAPRERQEGDEPRKPKRRVALLIGFCGTEYQGMQVNPNARTIEGDLFKALCEAGAVSVENAESQQKVQLQRAARTDKGVHAAGQVVSLKMIIDDTDIVDKINAHLADQIRVWGFVRVIQSFNAKTVCDSRIYEYLLPTYVLMEPSTANMELAKSVPFDERQVPETSVEQMKAKREYRVSEDKLQFVRDAFAKYKGTHDFRNFTVTRGCTDSNSKRHMHWFEVSDPMLIQGTEWLSLKVKGQSFMLHQIRKMVGLVILMARSGAPLELIDTLFGGPRVNVPKAPSLGLLLERPVFDGYNTRVEKQTQGSTTPVTFVPFQQKIDEFKQKYIYEAIFRTELAESVFDGWVKSAEVFPEQYAYINKEGLIPESTIVDPGTDRRLRFNSAAGGKNAAGADSSDDEADSKDN
ncbi:tRNA pseudouridine synthase 1 [Coemansia thaxteri]|uniref:tRNA pseudouridine synthase 1 n=1 Tax=Coemansia thaxteri TaxID=2663907 RepID=A0A9W8BMZ3_9FUNG|nr:tRNA pseudouridine synthase 1 [Coemansia thaxteri]KAJ2484080.1 tRNA pseudouridine synthase 1 [Coemansia sp. RSA 2320]